MSSAITVIAKVVPQSKRNAVEDATIGDDGYVYLKVRTTAPPVDGKANQAVVAILAEHFSTKKSNVELINGLTSRQKVLRIHEPVMPAMQKRFALK